MSLAVFTLSRGSLIYPFAAPFILASALLILVLGFAPPGFCDSQHIAVSSKPQVLPQAGLDAVRAETASIDNPDAAKKLLVSTLIGQDFNAKPFRDFAIIHVLKFKDSTGGAAQQVDSQNWYVFRDKALERWSQEDFASRKRMFGVKAFSFLYVLLNVKQPISFTPVYDIVVKAKLPTNAQDLFIAASLFVPTKEANEPNENFFGGGKFTLDYSTSDIVITPQIPHVDGLKAETFDNEGRAHWDVSAAIPIKRVSEASFDLTNSTVTPKTISRTNAFALLDAYVKPRDLKGSAFDWWPHPVAGIAIANQPLHKILTGVSWGTYFAEFYAGALFVKQAHLTNLSPGSTATPSQLSQNKKDRYDVQFSIGINIPIRAFQAKLKAGK